jgi:Serine hydrolase (FSH1)
MQTSDIPGLSSSDPNSSSSEAFAWWRTLDNVSEYREFVSTLSYLHKYIQQNGPVDGVIGFSQGATLAVMLTSWCESGTRPERRQALLSQCAPVTMEPPQGPMKFTVCYSGFRATPKYYGGFYSPKIQSPVLHCTAAVDTMVSDWGSQDLNSFLENVQVFSHPGGHYVPCRIESSSVAAKFIERQMLAVVPLSKEFYEPDSFYGSDDSLGTSSPSTSAVSSRSSSTHPKYRRFRSNQRRVALIRS